MFWPELNMRESDVVDPLMGLASLVTRFDPRANIIGGGIDGILGWISNGSDLALGLVAASGTSDPNETTCFMLEELGRLNVLETVGSEFDTVGNRFPLLVM